MVGGQGDAGPTTGRRKNASPYDIQRLVSGGGLRCQSGRSALPRQRGKWLGRVTAPGELKEPVGRGHDLLDFRTRLSFE